jgi:hypothetical protein
VHNNLHSILSARKLQFTMNHCKILEFL